MPCLRLNSLAAGTLVLLDFFGESASVCQKLILFVNMLSTCCIFGNNYWVLSTYVPTYLSTYVPT